MKRRILPLFILLAGSFVVPAQGAYRSFEHAAGSPPTETVDKMKLEGWIVKVDYSRSTFRLMDPRGFERTVTVKPGVIGDYRRGDHVRVTIDPDRLRASSIEKL